MSRQSHHDPSQGVPDSVVLRESYESEHNADPKGLSEHHLASTTGLLAGSSGSRAGPEPSRSSADWSASERSVSPHPGFGGDPAQLGHGLDPMLHVGAQGEYCEFGGCNRQATLPTGPGRQDTGTKHASPAFTRGTPIVFQEPVRGDDRAHSRPTCASSYKPPRAETLRESPAPGSRPYADARDASRAALAINDGNVPYPRPGGAADAYYDAAQSFTTDYRSEPGSRYDMSGALPYASPIPSSHVGQAVEPPRSARHHKPRDWQRAQTPSPEDAPPAHSLKLENEAPLPTRSREYKDFVRPISTLKPGFRGTLKGLVDLARKKAHMTADTPERRDLAERVHEVLNTGLIRKRSKEARKELMGEAGRIGKVHKDRHRALADGQRHDRPEIGMRSLSGDLVGVQKPTRLKSASERKHRACTQHCDPKRHRHRHKRES